MHLSSAVPGWGTPGLPGGNQLKLKKSVPQYRGLSGLLGLFLARGLGTFQASVDGCHCLPLSHCLSDLPKVETLLSDHARRIGELSNFNVKSCDSSRYPRGPPSRESRWQVHYEGSHFCFESHALSIFAGHSLQTISEKLESSASRCQLARFHDPRENQAWWILPVPSASNTRSLVLLGNVDA